ncbi:ABC transporter permease [Rhizobium sp. PL01]|uniref:ABC transporter permease n=1 Tax=Rhizobium sp. PL01 TaxID=3085631 RepID=UPI00298238A0|nr:ABC transporter permease [Rhizobium sp. PL01]MDW5317576.1 ABC transporter permease [Rhizobium sp. PL01]
MTQREPMPPSVAISTIARATISNAVRDRTVVWLALMFMAMVLLSAYLGWSATNTINQIYTKATIALQADGLAIPPNPVNETSPLAMLRNMTTYVSLLGALVAIVLGHQIIVEDRKSGVFPLLASRPISRVAYALGKMLALVVMLTCILLIAALTNAITLLILPALPPTTEDWIAFLSFYALSALLLTVFGWIAMSSASLFRSETMGLLVPVTVWLTLTFVLPQITSNINPMAALNPVKAMVPPPGGWFFALTGPALAPVSLISTYRDLAASILGFAPADSAALGTVAGLSSLFVANILLAAAACFGVLRLDPTRSQTDE